MQNDDIIIPNKFPFQIDLFKIIKYFENKA